MASAGQGIDRSDVINVLVGSGVPENICVDYLLGVGPASRGAGRRLAQADAKGNPHQEDCEVNMDFSKAPRGPVTPAPPAKHAMPEDDTDPSEEMFVWKPVLGPADGMRPSTPNPMTVEAPGIDANTALAAKLHWNT